LVEQSFAWQLIKQIGVYSEEIKNKVDRVLSEQANKPMVIVKREWYY